MPSILQFQKRTKSYSIFAWNIIYVNNDVIIKVDGEMTV